jgi:benzoate-CoA ligase
LKGDSLAAGYWNLHQQTAKRFRGEWYYTGDSYYCDEDGYFWYCGRQDDMIKSGGIWVSPIEVENTILEHPNVLEAAVVGDTDENGLQKPVAYVVAKSSVNPDELCTELRTLVRERLAHYKCPKRFVMVNELPKTETGKIQRFKLRDGSSA